MIETIDMVAATAPLCTVVYKQLALAALRYGSGAPKRKKSEEKRLANSSGTLQLGVNPYINP